MYKRDIMLAAAAALSEYLDSAGIDHKYYGSLSLNLLIAAGKPTQANVDQGRVFKMKDLDLSANEVRQLVHAMTK